MGQPAYPCPWCGQTPGAPPARSAKLDDHREEMQLDLAKRDLEAGARRKSRLMAHAVTGAITFFLLNLLLGLPMSLTLSVLATNAVTSVLLGMPIGYLISWFAAGRMRGALISMGVFFILQLIVGLAAREAGDTFRGVIAGAALRCPAGAIPGWIIGMHVEVDD